MKTKYGNIRASCVEKVFFAAGSSRSKYICSRAVASHPRQTSGNKAIADMNTTHAVNECARSISQYISTNVGPFDSIVGQIPTEVACVDLN